MNPFERQRPDSDLCFCKCAFILDSNNHQLELKGSIRDITGRKKVEEALKLSQIRRLANAVDLAHLRELGTRFYLLICSYSTTDSILCSVQTVENEGSYQMSVEGFDA